MITCNNCGCQNNDTSLICNNCGCQLEHKAGGKRKPNIVIIIVAIIGIIVMLCCCGFGLVAVLTGNVKVAGDITGIGDSTDTNIDEQIVDIPDNNNIDSDITSDNEDETVDSNPISFEDDLYYLSYDIDDTGVIYNSDDVEITLHSGVSYVVDNKMKLYIDICNNNKSKVDITVTNIIINETTEVFNKEQTISLSSNEDSDYIKSYVELDTEHPSINRDDISSISLKFNIKAWNDADKTLVTFNTTDCKVSSLFNSDNVTYIEGSRDNESLVTVTNENTGNELLDGVNTRTDGYYGDKSTGWVKLDSKWTNFKTQGLSDEQQDKMCQYSNGSTIVTLTNLGDVQPEVAINNIKNSKELDIENIQIVDDILTYNNTDIYGVYSMYPDGVVLYTSVFETDRVDGTIYIAVETVDMSLEEFKQYVYDIISTHTYVN